MQLPGEYSHPLVRKTTVLCPAISGYVTARLQAQDARMPLISGVQDTANVTLENIGTTVITIQLQTTNDRSISGARAFCGTSVTLVAGGSDTKSLTPFQSYLEVKCTGPTAAQGSLRMQIDSQRRWQQLGFDKGDPFYPPQLFQAKTTPGPL